MRADFFMFIILSSCGLMLVLEKSGIAEGIERAASVFVGPADDVI